MISESWEINLKNIALFLGVLSVIAIIMDWYPFTMFISLPFCLIWVYCGWLRSESQLKWVNVIFYILYLSVIVRYFTINRILIVRYQLSLIIKDSGICNKLIQNGVW